MQLFLQFGRAIKRTCGEGIFRIAFDEILVGSDRAFRVALFFGGLPGLKQLRCIPAYFFFAGRHVLGFFTRLEDNGPRTRYRQNQCSRGKKQDGTNYEIHEVSQGS